MSNQNTPKFKRKSFATSKNKRRTTNLAIDKFDFSAAANIVEN
jgi:hypothetical protein